MCVWCDECVDVCMCARVYETSEEEMMRDGRQSDRHKGKMIDV